MDNVEKVTNKIVEFIKDYYQKNNLKGAVIGISGGKDSGVVAALFTKALGPDNVVGIWMPCHSKEKDYESAKQVANHFGFELKEFDLTNLYDSYVRQIKDNNAVLDGNLVDANINIKPRLRMSTLYYHAAMLSSINNGIYIVPGTSNKCELYVGYFILSANMAPSRHAYATLAPPPCLLRRWPSLCACRRLRRPTSRAFRWAKRT